MFATVTWNLAALGLAHGFEPGSRCFVISKLATDEEVKHHAAVAKIDIKRPFFQAFFSVSLEQIRETPFQFEPKLLPYRQVPVIATKDLNQFSRSSTPP